MSEPLDIHLASPEERRQAHRNVYDVWSRGLPVERHVARREQAPHHQFAQWIVGTRAGRVVTSLACHPLEFSVRGKTQQGIGIASVHTVPEVRGQGLAPLLIEWTERWAAAAGGAVSLLFSDVDPDYYARMGYARCPAHHAHCDPREALPRLPSGDGEYRLAACDAQRELAELRNAYESAVGARPLSVHRYPEYWENLLARRPHDRFFWLHDVRGGTRGYLRMSPTPEPLFVTDPIGQPAGWKASDFALLDDQPAALGRMLAAAIRWAASQGANSFGGWFPNRPVVRQWLTVEPRPTEITMFKTLPAVASGPAVLWDAELLDAADWLCEIDHV